MDSRTRISGLIAAPLLRAILAAGVLIQVSAPTRALNNAGAGDWPQWRGPQRSGVSNRESTHMSDG
jgi:hypothetical protein